LRRETSQPRPNWQRTVSDQGLVFGLPAKYATGASAPSAELGLAWLTYARQMGNDRLLCGHPVNPRLFSAYLLAARPKPR